MFKVVPDFRFGPISTPSAETLANTAPKPSEQQLMLAAANAPLRFGYGTTRVGPLVVNAITDFAGNLLLDCVLGEGPIDALVSTEINDLPKPASVSVTFYNGTQVAPDPQLVNAWLRQGVNFTDVRPGIAYAVVKVGTASDVAIDDRSIAFTVRWLKVFDPRTATTAWSKNPALALAHFLSHPTLGYGETMDWDSVEAAADRCDELLGGKPRHTLGILFDQQIDKASIEETLRAAAGCFVAREGPITYLVPDAPIADLGATLHLEVSDWDPTTLRYSQTELERSPNSVAARWTNTALKPWAEDYTDSFVTAEVNAGTVDELPTVINGAWIQDYAEGVRLAKRYFAEYTVGVRSIEFEAFELAWKLRRGDVVRISNGVDLVEKAVRVQRIVPLGFAKVKIVGREYLTELYPDDVVADPVFNDSVLPDPSTVVAPTGLSMVEEVYLDQSQGATVATGAKYLSRFRVSWTHAEELYRFDYVIEFADGTTLVVSGSTTGTEFVSPAVQQGKLYRASVKTRNVLGFLSSAVETTATALGKLLPPSDIPAILSGFEVGGRVVLRWSPALDVDTLRYEWRYFPNGVGTWESALLLDRVDGLNATFHGLPVGTHRFYGKAIDSVGLYSANAVVVDIDVTSDADAFNQEHEFTNPNLTGANLVAIPPLEGVNTQRWATAIASDAWNSVMPNPLNSGLNPVISYHASATSKFVGEVWDLGAEISGEWSLTAPATVVSGSVSNFIETSSDGSTWIRQPGLSWSGAARFVRPIIEALTTSTFILEAPPKISVAAQSRSESGEVTTLASGGKLIALEGEYTSVQDLQGTAINTTSPRVIVFDRILLHPQAGLRMAWTISGVAGTSNAFALWDIFGSTRVLLVDDFLEFEVWLDSDCPVAVTSNPGVVNQKNTGIVVLHTGTGYKNLTDTLTGVDIREGAGMDVRGQWLARRASMAAFAGQTMDELLIGGDSDSNGDYGVVYRNIRVTNGAGVDRQAVWPPALGGSMSSEPSEATSKFSAFASNTRIGPANSLLAYAFNTSTSAQVAQDIRWNFRGF